MWIDWFFGCVVTTEKAENFIKGVYSKGKEKSKKAAIEAAKRASVKYSQKALELMSLEQRASYDEAFAKFDLECQPRPAAHLPRTHACP